MRNKKQKGRLKGDGPELVRLIMGVYLRREALDRRKGDKQRGRERSDLVDRFGGELRDVNIVGWVRLGSHNGIGVVCWKMS